MRDQFLVGNDRCPICSGHHPINAPCFLSTNWIPMEKTPMTTDYAKLVEGMKFSRSVLSDPYYRERMQEYIDAIEALVKNEDHCLALRHQLEAAEAEVEALVKERDEYLQFWKNNAEACEAAEAEVAKLKEALTKIANQDEPRPIVAKFRGDGMPSKHDKCGHNRYHYEDCGECISAFARRALEGK